MMEEFYYRHIEENPYEVSYRKAQKVLEIDALSMDSFADLYGAEKIQKDKELIDRLKKKFEAETPGYKEKQGHMLSHVLEAIIHHHGEQSDWFGPYARTFKTTEFDDFINGVDETVEFVEPGKPTSHMALAIDATFNADELMAEIKKILAKIDRGEMCQIKYFHSPSSGIRGELSLVPKVMIIADNKTASEISDLFVMDEKKLAEHMFARQLLYETVEQLDFYALYADSKGLNNIAQRYKYASGLIKKIIKEKIQNDNSYSQIDDFDQSYAQLLATLEILKERMKTI